MPILQLLTFVALASVAHAHSWIEQMSLIGSNGSYTAAYGYPRGYIARTDPGFNGFSDLWLLPTSESGRTRIDNTDLLCHPAQRTANQTSNYPALRVGPGSSFAMKYFENGHVSLPHNQKGKPEAGGTVFVYGTTAPKTDEKITDVMQWTTDGSGGDKRGRLLTAQNFDDGRCYQINGGTISVERQKQFPDPITGQPGTSHEQWCETDVTLPTDLKTGSYTLYWVWDWPTTPGQDPTYPTGKDEIYTTCADIQVEASEPAGPVSNTLTQQDPQMNAVPSYKSRTALAKTPKDLRPIGPPLSSSVPSAYLPTSASSTFATLASSSIATSASASAVTPITTPAAAAGQPPGLTLAPFHLSLPATQSETATATASGDYPTTSITSTAASTIPATGADQFQTLTATLTVVATLAAGQSGLVAMGPYEFTFMRSPEPTASATLKRSAKFRLA